MLLLLFVLPVVAQPAPAGRWITVDDETNTKKSVVQIYEKDGLLYGRIEELFPEEGRPPNPVCEKCDGEKKDQPIVGLEILWSMARDGDEWSGGRILDPEKGKIYRCKIWVDDAGQLQVRGYWGPFHRTQTWMPAGDAQATD